MEWHVPALVALLFGNILVGLMFLYVWGLTRERYLLWWALGIAAYILINGLYFVKKVSPDSDWATIAIHLCGLTVLLFFLNGLYGFIGRRLPAFWIWSMGGALAFILSTSLFGPDSLAALWPIYLFFGFVQVWSGILILREFDVGGLVRGITGGSFIIRGLHSCDYPFLRDFEAVIPFAYFLASFLTILGCFGLVFLYLARTRRQYLNTQERLAESNGMLEERVEARTRELVLLNSKLASEITERQLMGAALEESEMRHRRLVEALPCGVFEMDPAGTITYANPALNRLFGRHGGTIQGRNVSDLAQPGSGARGLLNELSSQAEKHASPVLYSGRIITDDGRLVDVDVNFSFKYDRLRFTGLIGVVTDVTARKRNEAEQVAYQKRLKKLASEIAGLEDKEKRRIAYELHERIGQKLAAAKIKLGVLSRRFESGVIGKGTKEIGEILGEAIHETRNLSTELSPPVLNELGFEAALEWLADEYNQLPGLEVIFTEERFRRSLDPDRQAFLFRGVSELLRNVKAHSGARRAWVEVGLTEDFVRVSVTDDGRGFNVEDYWSGGATGKGLGLLRLKEQLEHMSGCFEIESQPGYGTRAVISIPASEVEAHLRNA